MKKLLLAVLAALPAILFGSASAQERIFTVAGGGPDNQPATTVSLFPYAVAADGAGNVYFPSGSSVFVVDASGRIRIFAGTGIAGFSGDGRLATTAQLEDPRGVACDGSGNLFIADFGGNRIRRVDGSSGVITTIAGNGAPADSGDGGPALTAGIRAPYGVAAGPDGSIYVSQLYSHRVRRIDPSAGFISTVAGTGTIGFSGDGGPAVAAQIRAPHHLSVDVAGNLIIADTGNVRVRRVDAVTGIISTVAGSGTSGTGGDGGPALEAGFLYPAGVAVDSAGNTFITDYLPGGDGSWGGRVRRVDAVTGIITRVAGGRPTCCDPGDGGLATDALLFSPEGIAAEPGGDLLIADIALNYFGYGLAGIREVSAATQIIRTVAGGGSSIGDGGPAADALLFRPQGLALDGGGNVVIADTGNLLVRRVDTATGVITTVAGNGSFGYCGDGGPATSACFRNLPDVAVDAAGNIYIADQGNSRIRIVLAQNGIVYTVAGNATRGFNGDNYGTNSSLNWPFGVAVDGQRNLFIADTYNNRIRRLEATTNRMSTVAGNGNPGFSGDGGPATAAMLDQPTAVTLDPAGNIYVVDNARIRRVDAATGVITTVAGDGTFGYSGDGGPAVEASLAPGGVAADAQGNLLISDQGHRIRYVDASTGVITTVAGTGVPGFSIDGTPAAGAFVNLEGRTSGVEFHPSGGFTFTDTRNDRVRLVDARSIAAGSVPDGSTAPGDALDVAHAAGGRIALTWPPSCLAGDTDYEVYEAAIGAFDEPLPRLCTTGGLTTATFAPPSGNAFYLVVPRNGLREGSFGLRSDGTERPQGAVACLDRSIAPACGP